MAPLLHRAAIKKIEEEEEEEEEEDETTGQKYNGLPYSYGSRTIGT